MNGQINFHVIINDMFQSKIHRLKIVKLLQKKKRIYRNENILDDFSSFFDMRVEKFTRSKLRPSEIFHRKTQEQIIELECNERGTIPYNVSIVVHIRRMHIHSRNFQCNHLRIFAFGSLLQLLRENDIRENKSAN